jgi:AraC-like DNA-binding protein
MNTKPDSSKHLYNESELSGSHNHENQERFRISIIDIADFDLQEKIIPNRNDYFKIEFIRKNSKILRANISFTFTKNSEIFINPLLPKQKGYICLFTKDFFSSFEYIFDSPIFNQHSTAIFELNDEDAVIFEKSIVNLIEIYESDYLYKIDYLRAQVVNLIHASQMNKLLPDEKKNEQFHIYPSGRITNLFFDLLSKQFLIDLPHQQIKLKHPTEYADALCIHTNHLNKKLKKVTGKTTTQLINESIVQQATILLKNHNFLVSDIAWCFRFKESNHFSTFIKQNCGVRPKDLRN